MNFKRTPRQTSNLPPDLIGLWQHQDQTGYISVAQYRADGFRFAVSAYLPVTFSNGGANMIWGPESYTRLFGAGETLHGVWKEDSSDADYYFRPNGTFTYAEPGEIDLFGTYDWTGPTLRTHEARATVTVIGAELEFDIVFAGTIRQSFVLAGDTLTLDGTQVWTRIPALIYKIFRAPEWAALRRDATTTGAPIDVSDGYIHFSTAAQAAETAARHFAGADDLFLIAVETAGLGDALKWEASRGGALFPHLYRDMAIADVHWAQPLPLTDGVHQFPAGAGFDT